ncbi:tyrosine-type recombinase/integrase [Acinetobacter sp. YH12073]|uniref:tyrosine-type recombinase/integrase n=1 Tax=Acinetobacter sp. YH12073 TaxID=2601069 RepID=UPI0015D2C44B|nr:integrase arm-type DNA-binding domain-containing protein [Acinetobacter sp. YH12073]
MLNDTKIKQLKPRDKMYRMADHSGLCIEVRPNGSKHWRFRYRFLGKASMLSLGEYPVVSLAAARQKTIDQKTLLDQNIDPAKYRLEEKEQAKLKSESTFKDIALEWYEVKKNKRSESFRLTVEKAFARDLFPAFGGKDLKTITPHDVLRMQKDTIKRVSKQMNHGTGESTAIRNRQLVNSIFNYAIANLRCESNPAISLGQTVERPPKQTARPLTSDEKSRFNGALKNSRSTEMVKNSILLLLYSMMRSIEVCRLRWEWIDLENRLITIPPATKEQLDQGERNIKMNRTHLVPISDQIFKILESQKLQSNDEYVFCSVFNKSKIMNKTTINRALGSMGFEFTAHDFRATASTLLHESGYSSEWIELQLAHVDKNAVRGTYNHAQNLEERRKMMQDWADMVDSWS